MERIDDIEARLAAATPWPWKADTNLGCKDIKGNKPAGYAQAQYRTVVATTPGLGDEAEDKANAALIAHAPANLRDLVAVARTTAQLTAALRDDNGRGLCGRSAATMSALRVAEEALDALDKEQPS